MAPRPRRGLWTVFAGATTLPRLYHNVLEFESTSGIEFTASTATRADAISVARLSIQWSKAAQQQRGDIFSQSAEFLLALQRDLQNEALRLELARLDLSTLRLPTGVSTAAQLFAQTRTFLIRDGEHFYCHVHLALRPESQLLSEDEACGDRCIMHAQHQKLHKTGTRQLGSAGDDERQAKRIAARDGDRLIQTTVEAAPRCLR